MLILYNYSILLATTTILFSILFLEWQLEQTIIMLPPCQSTTLHNGLLQFLQNIIFCFFSISKIIITLAAGFEPASWAIAANSPVKDIIPQSPSCPASANLLISNRTALSLCDRTDHPQGWFLRCYKKLSKFLLIVSYCGQ